MAISVQTRQTREAILDAANRLLSRYGYKKMTIDDLAQEVGIGKGSVYLHFSSKEEIVLSHIDRIVKRLKEELSAIAATEASTEIRLQKMLSTRVLFRFDSVQHYTQSIDELLASLRGQVLVRRKKYFAEESQIFAEVIKQGQQNGSIRKGSPSQMAETFLLATNSLLPASLSTRELGDRDEIEEKTMRIANLLLLGILKR